MLPVRNKILIVSDSITLYSGGRKEKQMEQNSPVVLVFGWVFSVKYKLMSYFTQLLPKSQLLSEPRAV